MLLEPSFEATFGLSDVDLSTNAWHLVHDVRCQTNKSAIAKHAWSENHPINWSGNKILRRASHTVELVMKEALCTLSTLADSHFNRDSGYDLPDCWFALNWKLRGGVIVSHQAPGACAALRNYLLKSLTATPLCTAYKLTSLMH